MSSIQLKQWKLVRNSIPNAINSQFIIIQSSYPANSLYKIIIIKIIRQFIRNVAFKQSYPSYALLPLVCATDIISVEKSITRLINVCLFQLSLIILIDLKMNKSMYMFMFFYLDS